MILIFESEKERLDFETKNILSNCSYYNVFCDSVFQNEFLRFNVSSAVFKSLDFINDSSDFSVDIFE